MDPSELEQTVVSSVRDLANARPLTGDARAASSQFLVATSEIPNSNLGYWEQVIRSELNWAVNRPGSLNLWVTKTPHGPWINLFNGNGYEREKALNAIVDGAPNEFLFAIMLRRLNDWVPQVRSAARRAVERTTAKTESKFVVESLWRALPHLHSWGRWHEPEKEALVDLVCVGDVPGQLASKIMRSVSGPVATVLSQAARRSVIDEHLLRIARYAVQPAVRAKAYRFIFDEQATWLYGRKWVWTDKYWGKGRHEPVLGSRRVAVDEDQLTLLREAAIDRSPAVRRVAAAAVIAKLPELGQDALPLATALATDSYPSIAERGQFALDRIG